MNILMLTNVFTPQVGGVTRSIQQFVAEYRGLGHRVLVVAPNYPDMPEDEADVVRVSAIPDFYEDRYPLPLPLVPSLIPEIAEFQADVVHAHHPFLLGTTGQVIAADLKVPLVYTHHTRYSMYIEKKTNWPRAIEDAIGTLVVNYCELCDTIVAPSDGIRQMLIESGVTQPIEVVPTGVDTFRFQSGDGDGVRESLGIPQEAYVVGHVGRLAPEKNCRFLCQAVGEFLRRESNAWFLIVGSGSEEESMRSILEQLGVADRVCWAGALDGQQLVDAYHAMDVFAFASHTETQGMVLAEAMAAGLPVVAVHGTGVKDLIEDGINSWLIPRDDANAFAAALQSAKNVTADEQTRIQAEIRKTVNEMSMPRCAERMLDVYGKAIANYQQGAGRAQSPLWDSMLRSWKAAWDRWKIRAKAVGAAAASLVQSDDDSRPSV